MQDYREQMDKLLREGDPQGALAIAAKWSHKSDLSAKETAIEIARCAGEAYRDFVIEPVHAFASGARDALDDDIGVVVEKALGRLVRMTEEWETRLRSVYEERLARDLRDRVRAKQWFPALDLIRSICHVDDPGDADARARHARYVGGVLGDLVNQPREAEHVLRLVAKDPGSYGLDAPLAAEMRAAWESRRGDLGKANLETIESQWTSTLRQAQAEILNKMPNANKMGDPGEDDMREVRDLFLAVLRIPLWLRFDEMFVDATMVLVDFIPTARKAGLAKTDANTRSYDQLGFAAKKATQLVFQEVGRKPLLTEPYREWAAGSMGRTCRDEVVEFMGALRAESFAPFFITLWKDRDHRDLRPEIAQALGNMASPEATGILLQEYRDVVSRKASSVGEVLKRANEFRASDKTIDPATIKRARRLLNALGRIARSPRTSQDIQREIITKVLEATPDDKRLNLLVAMEVLSAKPQLLEADQVRAGIRSLVDALFVQDQSTAHHRGDTASGSLLGARATVANNLRRLGGLDPSATVEQFDRYCARYGGGMVAAAELLPEMAGEQAVPTLQRMLMTASSFDDGAQNNYQRETVWDPANEQRVPLTPDRVISSLVYGLKEIGGDQALGVLREFQKQIQMGRVRHAEKETIAILAEAVGMPGGGEAGGASEEVGETGAATPDRPAGIDPADIRKLIKDVTGSHLFSGAAKRAEKKISALVQLGNLTPDEALDPIFEALGDKDSMVQAAAVTALCEYAAPGKPGYLFEDVMQKLEEAFSHKSSNVREQAPRLLKALGPHRPEVRKRVAQIAKSLTRNEDKLRLKRAVETAGLEEAVQDARPGGINTPDPEEEGPADAVPAGGGDGRLEQLEAKRAYFEARRQWVAGGKKGDPPQRPPGV